MCSAWTLRFLKLWSSELKALKLTEFTIWDAKNRQILLYRDARKYRKTQQNTSYCYTATLENKYRYSATLENKRPVKLKPPN